MKNGKDILRLTAEDFVHRADRCGMSIRAMCIKAGVHESVFYRWRAGTQRMIPHDKYAALYEATEDTER